MDRRSARLALGLAERWTNEGLMPPASLAVLRRRHAVDAREDPDAESFGAAILYALGGVLLGAAAIAFLVLMDDNGLLGSVRLEEAAPGFLLGWGALCSLAAFLIDGLLRKPRLADAFHVAALVDVTAAAFPRLDDWPWLALLSIAYALAILAYRRRVFLVPFLALAAANAAWAAFLLEGIGEWTRGNGDAPIVVWFLTAAVQVGLLAFASRVTRWPWPTLSLGTATLLMAGTFLAVYFDVLDEALPSFRGDVEVYLALLMGAALGSGLALREKGLVLASALVVAIDAIVFAFDVGEIVGGLLALLAVAALLIWQAGNLRRYLRDD